MAKAPADFGRAEISTSFTNLDTPVQNSCQQPQSTGTPIPGSSTSSAEAATTTSHAGHTPQPRGPGCLLSAMGTLPLAGLSPSSCLVKRKRLPLWSTCNQGLRLLSHVSSFFFFYWVMWPAFLHSCHGVAGIPLEAPKLWFYGQSCH